MRSTIAKSLKHEIVREGNKQGLSSTHIKRIYKQAKKDYNKTPRPLRSEFSVFE